MGDGYAAADPRILMLGKTNHGTTSDGADRTYTDGVVRRAFRDAARGNGNHWIRTVRNISVMLTGNTYGGPNAVWDTVAYGVSVNTCKWKRTAAAPATSEETTFGRETFLAMLDVLKTDLVIVRGLTLFIQLCLSS